ncbi:DUF1015 domain-containing protein [uncultured Slackia sp.]|uniref:DUF1015 domain-containing protein n=1 Tax=Slackia isoflavoniconvertens TaxID=572010 RepID=UPI000D7A413B|nr:DUF1015 family protein [uncultured Slackia sp.]PWM46970.1 MAG: DUF1015 domain-containing protein [Coriobacteriia bacterium]
MIVKPFAAVRPTASVADQVAALPYDVYDRAEAVAAVDGEPLSFLNIDRPETQFPADADMYAPEVYAKARELFDARRADGTFVTEPAPCFYLYELTMGGRSQTGVVACCAIDDYLENVIKKHENTLEKKELDRIRHIDALDAQTGPIFLTYRDSDAIDILVAAVKKTAPLYDFAGEDGVTHRVWRMAAASEETACSQAYAGLVAAFAKVPCAYIADGHHRAASAVKVGLARREANPGYDGTEEFNYFMSVLFPASQLSILAYNRVVRDLNGLTKDEFLNALAGENGPFEIIHKQESQLEPIDKGAVGMYLDREWYGLGVKPEFENSDPVEGLDVSILQEKVLAPILGIGDPRTDERIEFVGGIRGLRELERKVNRIDARGDGPAVAFAMFPTSIDELLNVADAGRLMPPKSTWFEPKLRSGLFAHLI